MSGSLEVTPDAPLVFAPIALIEEWKHRVPRSHRDLVGVTPPIVMAVQLGAWDSLVLARKGTVTLLPHDKGVLFALGPSGVSPDQLLAAVGVIKKWEEAGVELPSDGRRHAACQTTERLLEVTLPEGRYWGTFAKAKAAGKAVVFVRLERTGDLRPKKLDVPIPPVLSDADFDAAEALTWVSLSEETVAIVDATKKWKGPAKAAQAPKRAGDALVAPSGSALLAWPIAGGLLLAGSEGGDAPDNVAAMLAVPATRFVDTGLTLEVTSGKVRVFDPIADEESVVVPVAKGSYRVARAEGFRTAAAELASVLRLTKE